MNITDLPHPWQQGPAELLMFALEHSHRLEESSQKVAFLLLDIAVETTCKTYLALPAEVTSTELGYGKRNDAVRGGSFHDVLRVTQDAAGKALEGIPVDHIEHYHNMRNKLYHDGDGITVSSKKVRDYAKIATELLDRLLQVDLSEYLQSPAQRKLDEPHIAEPNEDEQIDALCQRLQVLAHNLQQRLENLAEQRFPQVLMPSFSRAWIRWVLHQDFIPYTFNFQEEYDAWEKKTLTSIPDELSAFTQEYLVRDIYETDFEQARSIKVTDLHFWLTEVQEIVPRVIVMGAAPVDVLAVVSAVRRLASMQVVTLDYDDLSAGSFGEFYQAITGTEYYLKSRPEFAEIIGPSSHEVDYLQERIAALEELNNRLLSLINPPSQEES